MKKDITISENIKYIGVDDHDIDLFEGQYVVPNGISYNSYIIKDEKIAVMDTVDRRKSEEWLDNLEKELAGKEPDYLVVSHMEPDHSYNIGVLAEKYPNMKIIGNDKIFEFMKQFFEISNLDERKIVVHKAISSLKTEYRQVLWLCFFEELSNEEVAQIMGKSKRQIENLVYRAKQTLKSVLDKEGFEYEKLWWNSE